MIIDGEIYKALFPNLREASDFVNACEDDGSTVSFVECHKVTPEDIIDDDDFEIPYKIEMISEMLIPNSRKIRSWRTQEEILSGLGYRF